MRTVFVLEAPPGIGPGIRVLQTRALPLGHGAVFNFVTNADANESHPHCSGADYGARTRHLRLGKATLYQMS